jgi:sterol desaturase/sphingolipid hydroxylase (fatty acid hydroxylase superfamily)
MRVDYERHSTARMFQSEFLETCSKIHPVTPFVVFIPVVVGTLAYGLARGITTLGTTGLFFGLGFLVWCTMEYSLHRFLFHWEGSGPLTRRFHDIIHGYHHRYPDDPLRLVMPLGASIPLGILVAGLLWLVGRPAATLPLYAGIVTGYLFYDFMHWAVHARTPVTAWGKALRSHHMAHHFAVPDKNFGISHRWLDALVGTLKRRTTA